MACMDCMSQYILLDMNAHMQLKAYSHTKLSKGLGGSCLVYEIQYWTAASLRPLESAVLFSLLPALVSPGTCKALFVGINPQKEVLIFDPLHRILVKHIRQ